MEISVISGQGYASNSYILSHCGRYAIVDPSMPPRHAELCGLRPTELDFILLTHGHFDHVLELDNWKALYPDTRIGIHVLDSALLTDSYLNASRLLIFKNFTCKTHDFTFVGGENIELGGKPITVYHTPGHTEGSCCFYTDGKLICGDTLFKLSVGRWDLPGGDCDKLIASMKCLSSFPDDTVIYPGHGGISSIGYEKKHNTFLTNA